MFTQLTQDTYKNAIETAESGVLICFKKLCPHCKNMEKVLEKFAAQRQGLRFFSLDSEEESQAMRELGAERVPTILVLKHGKVAATKAGLMNPREMAAFYDAAKP